MMISIIKQLLDWIYYNNCYFCHKPSSSGLMCDSCYKKIEINSPKPIKIISNIKIYSASSYTGNLKKLIKGLKYHKKKELAKPLANILYNFWQNTELKEKSFELVPIPLYLERKKQRGYDHILLTAKEFSKLTGYSLNTKIVERIKNTKPQYKLSKIERMDNLKGAFKVTPDEYKETNLLLIDDICTSGATLGELINILNQNNITNIYAIVGGSNASILEI
ncbi:MAG: ComF family protein [bacterium]